MEKDRLEAFSDGVIAILITILVLEFKAPHGDKWTDLLPMLPTFGAYVLSFLYLGIYWNNHHHMLQTITKTNGSILWANLHFLFWLSLIPFATGWMGESYFTGTPIAFYGIILFMAGNSYFILQKAIIRFQGKDSILGKAIGKDKKGKVSIVSYLLAIVISFKLPSISVVLYIAIALLWLIPDKRIERTLSS